MFVSEIHHKPIELSLLLLLLTVSSSNFHFSFFILHFSFFIPLSFLTMQKYCKIVQRHQIDLLINLPFLLKIMIFKMLFFRNQ